jgi:hypothetical protein
MQNYTHLFLKEPFGKILHDSGDLPSIPFNPKNHGYCE